jgi:hypothetical protein
MKCPVFTSKLEVQPCAVPWLSNGRQNGVGLEGNVTP